jgi:hypothetical protein
LIYNKQHTKEEYESFVAQLDPASTSLVQATTPLFMEAISIILKMRYFATILMNSETANIALLLVNLKTAWITCRGDCTHH